MAEQRGPGPEQPTPSKELGKTAEFAAGLATGLPISQPESKPESGTPDALQTQMDATKEAQGIIDQRMVGAGGEITPGPSSPNSEVGEEPEPEPGSAEALKQRIEETEEVKKLVDKKLEETGGNTDTEPLGGAGGGETSDNEPASRPEDKSGTAGSATEKPLHLKADEELTYGERMKKYGGREVMSLAERDLQLKIVELKKAGKMGEAADLEKISAEQQTEHRKNWRGKWERNTNAYTTAAEGLRAAGMEGAADEMYNVGLEHKRETATTQEQEYQDVKSQVVNLVSQTLKPLENDQARAVAYHAEGSDQKQAEEVMRSIKSVMQADRQPFFSLKSKSPAGGKVLEIYYKCAADQSGKTLLVERRNKKTGEIISVSTVKTNEQPTKMKGIFRRAERPTSEAIAALGREVRAKDNANVTTNKRGADDRLGGGYSATYEQATGYQAAARNKPRRRTLMDFFLDSLRN